MITPEIREIQVFLALTRTGSFSAAAKELGITQPAVSLHISKFEQMIGVPLFHRLPEGTSITEQGSGLLPYIENVEREYQDLIRRADYWKRSQSHEVKIWADGSLAAQELRRHRNEADSPQVVEIWRNLEPSVDWVSALKNFEVDVVITGSYLKVADSPGIRTSPVLTQAGLTVAWNPDYYAHDRENFSFPDALSTTAILPTDSLAAGFREFLLRWCETTYGFKNIEFIEFKTEHEAVEACKLGLGVMIFPGDALARLGLGAIGLETQPAFGFLLPKAFVFGVRWRTNEQNPQIVATVKNLVQKLSNPPRLP
jgi:DNA-binding transcriptional LysR family regulator